MMQMANIFGPLSKSELSWALTAVQEQGIAEGFWLGQAAMNLTNKKSQPESKKVLEQASEKGNELSAFILKCLDS